jgi:hypothetical protein
MEIRGAVAVFPVEAEITVALCVTRWNERVVAAGARVGEDPNDRSPLVVD